MIRTKLILILILTISSSSSKCENINIHTILYNVFTNCRNEKFFILNENKLIRIHNREFDTLDIKVHLDTIFINSENKTTKQNSNKIKFYTFKQIDSRVNNYLVYGYYDYLESSESRNIYINRRYILNHANAFDYLSIEFARNKKIIFYKSRNFEIFYSLNNKTEKIKRILTPEQFKELVEILYKSQIQFSPTERKCNDNTHSIKIELKIWSNQYSSICCDMEEVQNKLINYAKKLWSEYDTIKKE